MRSCRRSLIALAVLTLSIPAVAASAAVPRDGYWSGTSDPPVRPATLPSSFLDLDFLVRDGKLRVGTGPRSTRPGSIHTVCVTESGYSGSEFPMPKPSPLKPSRTGRFSMRVTRDEGAGSHQLTVEGRFTSRRRASGTYRWVTPSGCDSGEIPWKARWKSRRAPSG
jgi:hypothetical protein